MKLSELITDIVFILILIVIAILNKRELLEVKKRYEIVQQEKQYLQKQIMLLENKI